MSNRKLLSFMLISHIHRLKHDEYNRFIESKFEGRNKTNENQKISLYTLCVILKLNRKENLCCFESIPRGLSAKFYFAKKIAVNRLTICVFYLISVVLKDVSYTVMTELLQFMYQGVVNVKHTELNSFMKIAQQLQIKGLATSTTNQPAHQSHGHHHAPKSPNSPVSAFGSKSALDSYSNAFHSSSLIGQKRSALDYSNLNTESTSSKKHMKRSSDSVDNDVSTESMENMSSEDGFPIPQISMIESGRFDLNNVKRETSESMSSPGASRNLPAPFNFEYNRM